MTSRFFTYTVIYEAKIKSGERLGQQVTFGKKVSNLHIVFYDKKKERIAQGYRLQKPVDNWTRCEIRFRAENAKSLFKKMCRDYNGCGLFIQGILRHYLSFKVGVYDGVSKNKFRDSECRWWTNFTQNVPRCKFEHETIGSSIFTKRAYADMNLSKFISLLYLADKDFFDDMLQKGADKITDYDVDVLNAYFIQTNAQIIQKDELINILKSGKK